MWFSRASARVRMYEGISMTISQSFSSSINQKERKKKSKKAVNFLRKLIATLWILKWVNILCRGKKANTIYWKIKHFFPLKLTFKQESWMSLLGKEPFSFELQRNEERISSIVICTNSFFLLPPHFKDNRITSTSSIWRYVLNRRTVPPASEGDLP